MGKWIPSAIRISVTVLLAAIFVLFLARKIDLTVADLGRHITNGYVVVHGSMAEKWAVLHTNFYSYTLPNQPFINHHWLSGVVFYLFWKMAGFVGLSVFYVGIGIMTFLFYFYAAKKSSNEYLAALLSLLLMPLMAFRAEVRPEIITYLFSGACYTLLWQWHKGHLQHKYLLVLPILMLLWVNLHIGFIFGLFLIGAFGLEHLTRLICRRANGFVPLLVIGILSATASLANPSGWRGLLYPFFIFRQYGYMIVENQSVMFLTRLGMNANMPFTLLAVCLGLGLLSFVALAIKDWRKISLVQLLIFSVFGSLAVLGIRHIPSFAFFALPIMAGNFYEFRFRPPHAAYRTAAWLVFLAAVTALSFQNYSALAAAWSAQGLGLMNGASEPGDFLRQQQVAGPIFNNYDIGGYLIYYLYPGQRIFVDNRPEAYPVSFFEDVYKPAQVDSQKWQQLDGQYHFNAIVFSYRDYTAWGQQFLVARIQDPQWAPVYAQNGVIIFLKKKAANMPIIEKYLVPSNRFNIIQN